MNPNEEVLLARALGQIEERVGHVGGELLAFRLETQTAHKQLLERMTALERREGERNGTIVELAQWRARAELQMGEHLEAAAERSRRLGVLEARHDKEDARADGVAEERTRWQKRLDFFRKEGLRGVLWLAGAGLIAAWRLLA